MSKLSCASIVVLNARLIVLIEQSKTDFQKTQVFSATAAFCTMSRASRYVEFIAVRVHLQTQFLSSAHGNNFDRRRLIECKSFKRTPRACLVGLHAKFYHVPVL